MKWLYCSNTFSQIRRLNVQVKPITSENVSMKGISDLKISRIIVVFPYFN